MQNKGMIIRGRRYRYRNWDPAFIPYGECFDRPFYKLTEKSFKKGIGDFILVSTYNTSFIMTTKIKTKEPIHSLTRVFDAPCEIVWKAWTMPEKISKWFSASSDIRIKVHELDVRPTGHFRFSFSNPVGKKIPGEYTGSYIIVKPLKELTFKVTDFSMPEDPTGITAIFRVQFDTVGMQTQLTLTETLPDEAYNEITINAWNICFDNLDKILKN